MIFEYERPIAEIILYASVMPICAEFDPSGPSSVEEGFEKWPE